MTIEERIYKVIREQLGKVRLTPETRFIGDLACDSLDGVELVMELEEEFDLEIPTHDFCDEEDKTVGQAVAYITRRLEDGQTKLNLPPGA